MGPGGHGGGGNQGGNGEDQKFLDEAVELGVIGTALGAWDNSSSSVANSADAPPKRSVPKAAVTGAGIGAVLYPALGLIVDTFSKNKSFVPGNRLRFLTSQASFGAALNATLNGTIAWVQNKIAARKFTDRIEAGKQNITGRDQMGIK